MNHIITLKSSDMVRLNNKQKRKIRREVALELDIQSISTSIHKNNKKYNRNTKHRKADEKNNIHNRMDYSNRNSI